MEEYEKRAALRLTNISDHEMRSMIEAVHATHAFYLERVGPSRCILCRKSLGCRYCPWFILEAIPCTLWLIRELEAEGLDDNYYLDFRILYNPKGDISISTSSELKKIKTIRRKRLALLTKWEKVLEMERSRRNLHLQDEHCTIGENGCCTVCGVDHSEVCLECGGRGFHKYNCPIMMREYK